MPISPAMTDDSVAPRSFTRKRRLLSFFSRIRRIAACGLDGHDCFLTIAPSVLCPCHAIRPIWLYAARPARRKATRNPAFRHRAK